MEIKNIIRSYVEKSIKNSTNPVYNILVIGSTHERYEEQLCKTGHNFYVVENGKKWDRSYAKIPDNYIVKEFVPMEVCPDFILTHVAGERLEIANEYAKFFGVKVIRHTHTLPESENELRYFRSQRADINTFISEFSKNQWGVDGYVVNHGLDTDVFQPVIAIKNKKVLSVVNQWKNRDWACGWSLYQSVVKMGGEYRILGNNPGLSLPARSTKHLVSEYSEASVFLNTSLHSPVPMSLLEAMACGCPVVSTDTCMIPEIIEHGVNGFMSSNPKKIKEYIDLILNDDKLAQQLGENARKTILDKFNIQQFTNAWNQVFYKATF